MKQGKGSDDYRPFTVKVPENKVMEIHVGVVADGRGGKRFYFDDPTRPAVANGRGKMRRPKVQSRDKAIITQEAERKLREIAAGVPPLTREDYERLRHNDNRVAWLEQQMEGTELTPELAVSQTASIVRRLKPEGVTLAQALDDVVGLYLPKHPMTAKEIGDELGALLAANVSPKHATVYSSYWRLIYKLPGPIHRIRPTDLEQLLHRWEAGEFLTEAEKKRWRAQKNRKPPVIQDGREIWYRAKSLRNCREGWNRLFVRARDLEAWPRLRPLPTQVMEWPKADPADLRALSPEGWAILLPKLAQDPPLLRLAVLVLSDIRKAEIKRLVAQDIKTTPAGVLLGTNDPTPIPTSVDVQPHNAKGAKGRRKGRNVTLLPYASALLARVMPQGDQLFPGSVDHLMLKIYALARELGLEPTHNCLRRMHDTYWYALLNTQTEVNADRSHTKRLTDTVYRSVASFEAAVSVYTTFPPGIPPHLRAWVERWVAGFRGLFRGIPISGPSHTRKSEARGTEADPPRLGEPKRTKS